MAKRRHPDRHSMGRSRRAPFVAGETSQERHTRRLRVALAARDVLATWLEQRGLSLRVNDAQHQGQHWQVKLGRRVVLDWWPSSAKAVLMQRWRQGVHCHDVDQLRELVATHLLRELWP